jgi:hypothetical protein
MKSRHYLRMWIARFQESFRPQRRRKSRNRLLKVWRNK